MRTKVKIGDYELLDSIAVIGIDKTPIELIIGEDDAQTDNNKLSFVFSFENDEENKEQRIEYSTENNTRGNIKLINMNFFLGGGTTQIIKIGKYMGCELYYNLRIFSLKQGSNLLIVNFYKGKEVTNA